MFLKQFLKSHNINPKVLILIVIKKNAKTAAYKPKYLLNGRFSEQRQKYNLILGKQR